MDTGGEDPADSGGFNRFLDGFESFVAGLNRVERGDDVRCEVDGELSGQFNFEPRSLAEKPR